MREFATIKRTAQASDVAHAVVDLPLTAKVEPHDKHNQSDQDMYSVMVELEREEQPSSHCVLLPTPNVIALGVSCVERNRTRKSHAAPCFATNITLQEKAFPVYRERAR